MYTIQQKKDINSCIDAPICLLKVSTQHADHASAPDKIKNVKLVMSRKQIRYVQANSKEAQYPCWIIIVQLLLRKL